MSEGILNLNYRDTLDKIDSYEEYLSSMHITLDTQLWKKSLSLNSKDAYQKYLNKYPKGNYAYEAQVKIDKFNAVEESEQEVKAWNRALNKNSKSSYEKYLMSYYNGLHSNEAKRKVDEFIRVEKENRLEEQRLRDIEIAKEIVKLEKIEKEKKLALEKEVLEKEYRHIQNNSVIRIENEFMLRKAKNIYELKNTTTIQYKSEYSIPSSIGDFKNLKRLSIVYPFRGKVRVDVPLSIRKLINLEELGISNCTNSIGLSSGFSNFKNLKHLFLTHIHNFEFTEYSVRFLTNLQSLTLMGCDLYGLPKDIQSLQKLEKIDLSNNKLNEIPESLKNLRNLKVLQINYNNINKIPEWIKNFNKLEELKITSTKIKDLPDFIFNLKNLKKIEAKYCKFSLLKQAKLKMKYKDKIQFS